ncbi:MAG TPA: hypothetical protein VD971_11500 [Phycisphaerales bacterium]|nr:hypothetical protein [Phycisphaerales bacterium]
MPDTSAPTTPAPVAASPRKRRRWPYVVGGVVLLLLVLVLLAPTIASGLAPGVIRSQASKYVEGDVTVGDASLSWGGPQRVGPITWNGPDGQSVARMTVAVDAGLMALATGGLNLGVVEVSDGEMRVVRRADGKLAMAELVKRPQQNRPAQPAAKEPARLPKGLRAHVTVKSMDITFIDEAGQGGAASPTTITLQDVQGEAGIDPGQPLVVKLNATTSTPGAQPGRIAIDARATNWADANGELTPTLMDADAKVTVEGLPLALADALLGPIVKDAAGAAVPLARSIGPIANAQITFTGGLKDASAQVRAQAERLDVAGDLRVTDGVLTNVSPVTVSVRSGALPDLVPALRGALDENGGGRITQLPDAAATIQRLSVRLPQDGKPLDLRGSAIDATLSLTRTTGLVRLRPNEQPRESVLEPLSIRLTSDDLAQGLKVQGGTRATIGGEPAGTAAIDATVAGLLDENGAPVTGVPRNISGAVRVQQIATAIAQPFVQPLGIVLAEDIGPVADVELTANTPQGQRNAIDADVRVVAENLSVAGSLRASPAQIQSKGGSFTVEARSLGRIARALTREGPWVVQGAEGAPGRLSLTEMGFTIPLKEGAPVVEQTSAYSKFAVEGLAAAPREATRPDVAPIVVRRMSGGAAMRPGMEVDSGFSSTLAYTGQEFNFGVDVKGLDLPEPAATPAPAAGNAPAAGPATPAAPALIPLPGSFKITLANMPVAAANLFLPVPTEQGAPDLAAVLRDALGDRLTVRAQGTPVEGSPETMAIEFSAQAPPGLNLAGKARATPRELATEPITGEIAVSPQSLDAILRNFAPEMQDKPTLVGPTRVQIAIAPVTVPLNEKRVPQFANAQPINATVRIPGRTMVETVVSGRPARVGVEELELRLEAPASMLAPAPAAAGAPAPKPASVTLNTSVVSGEGLRLATVSGRASRDNAAGGVALGVNAADIDTAAVDAFLGRPGLLAGVLGDSAAATIDVTMDTAFKTGRASVSLTAPNVTTNGPVAVRMTPASLELENPARLQARIDPGFVSGLLSTDGKPPAMVLAEATRADVTVSRLLLPRAAPGVPAPPPDVNLAASIPRALLRSADGHLLTLNNTHLEMATRANAPHGDRPVDFTLAVEDARAPDAAQSGRIALAGSVTNLVDAQGAFSMAGARLNAKGEMPGVPTALVDALARKDGLLVDALGPIVRVNADVRGFPLGDAPGGDPGSLTASLESDRARANITGDLREAVLVTTQPVTASLSQITTALSGRFLKGLPLFGSFEKQSADAPAMLRGENVTIPLSNDLGRLNGVFTIDPGEARFSTSGAFSRLLDVAGLGGVNGMIGQRLQPLTVTVREGVATYPYYEIPLGEFTIATEGRVDLVGRKLDVITWVPIGALTDQAAGRFNTGLGSLTTRAAPVLSAASMVPFRTSGALDNPETDADMSLFAETTLKNLRPDRLIREGVGSLLDRIRGDGEEPK